MFIYVRLGDHYFLMTVMTREHTCFYHHTSCAFVERDNRGKLLKGPPINSWTLFLRLKYLSFVIVCFWGWKTVIGSWLMVLRFLLCGARPLIPLEIPNGGCTKPYLMLLTGYGIAEVVLLIWLIVMMWVFCSNNYLLHFSWS